MARWWDVMMRWRHINAIHQSTTSNSQRLSNFKPEGSGSESLQLHQKVVILPQVSSRLAPSEEIVQINIVLLVIVLPNLSSILFIRG